MDSVWISVEYVFVAVQSGFEERWGTDYFDKARCIAHSLDMSTMTIISRCRNRGGLISVELNCLYHGSRFDITMHNPVYTFTWTDIHALILHISTYMAITWSTGHYLNVSICFYVTILAFRKNRPNPLIALWTVKHMLKALQLLHNIKLMRIIADASNCIVDTFFCRIINHQAASCIIRKWKLIRLTIHRHNADTQWWIAFIKAD